MNEFSEIAKSSSLITINLLSELNSKIKLELTSIAPKSSIKNLKAIRMTKTIYAIGLISVF